MADVGTALRVPVFLSASDREGLVRLMLENNLSKGKEHRYFDITFDGTNWTCWFYEQIKITGEMLINAPTRESK